MPSHANLRLTLLTLMVVMSVALPRAAFPPPPTCTWTGGGADGNWSTAANWDNCGGAHPVPIDGDALAFPDAASRKTNANDIGGLDLSFLQFTGYDYVITGNAVTLSNGISSNLINQPSGTSAPHFNVDVTLLAAQTFTASGTQGVFLHGTLNLNGFALTVTGAGPTGLIGSIVGAGGITTTAAELFLQGPASTYTGVTNVNSGAIQVGSANGLGATGPGNGTIIAPGARLELNGDTAPVTINEAITIGTTVFGSLFQNTTQPQTLAGPITLTGDVEIVNNISGVLSLTGPITGPAGINRTGFGGTVILSGVNTYSGTTTATQSLLLINGSQPGSAVVVAGGTLGGTGTIGALSSTSGSVAPGASPGILNSGSVTWNSATTYAVEINGTVAGTGYDRLNVTGAVSLGSATLSASLGFLPVVGSTFTIIDNDGADPVVGIFNGLPQGAQVLIGPNTFTISYTGGTGNDVVLTATAVVPSMPWSMLALTAAALLVLAAARLRPGRRRPAA